MADEKRDWWNRDSGAKNQTVAAVAHDAGCTDGTHPSDRHLPTLFLVVGAVIGLLYAFMMPPLQVADEGSHFARLYSVSRGVCVASPDVDIPQSFAQLNESFPPWLERHRKISIADLRPSLKIPFDPFVMAGNGRQRSLDEFVNQNLYFCLPYVPASLVLNLGRHVGLSPLELMYLSRVSNLAVYLALTFLALRLLPHLRWILFCVALMPMVMHQAASVSADSMSFALAFLLCAYVFRLAFGRQPEAIGVRQYLVLGVLIVLVALTRSLPAVVVLPLVIPSARFGSPRNRWLAIAAYTLLTVLCVGFWQHLNQANLERLAEARMMRAYVVDVHSNIRFLREHPVETASIFLRTVTDFHYIRAKSTEIVGRFGWLSVSLPGWLVCLYLALLVASATTQSYDAKLTWPARGMLLLFVAAGAANTLAAGWVLETPIVVLGVPAAWPGFRVLSQGRYWIPLAFPALILLANTKARLNPRVFAGIALAVILIANGVAFHIIRTTYYN